MAADIPNVDIPMIDIFYVQAHGGGAHSLENVITTYNNYERLSSVPLSVCDIGRAGVGFKNNNHVFPMIGRVVSPGKSANSDFDSDKQTVNYIRNILLNDDFRRAENLQAISSRTRSSGGAHTKGEGYRRIGGELKKNVSFYCADEPIFNETVEVELISGRIFAGKEDVKENPGGFGIWKCGGDEQGWKYERELSETILQTATGNSKDIQILEIVKQLTTAFNNKNIIVIFPNCSPFGVESWTSSQRRAVRNPRMKGWTVGQQFQQTLLMLSRIQNFYQGNKNFNNLLLTGLPGVSISCEYYDEKEKWQDGPIGVMDKEDSQFLYSVLDNIIKKYPLNDDLFGDNNEFTYIRTIFIDSLNIDVIKYIYLLLLFAFRYEEIDGGIFRDTDDRKTLSNLNRELNEKIETFLGKGDASQELRKSRIKEIRDCLILSDMFVNQSTKYDSRIDAWNNLKTIAKGLSLIDEVDVGGGGGGGGQSKLSDVAAETSHYGGIKRKKRTRKNKRKKKKGKKKKTRKKRKTRKCY